jgi:surface protein
MNNLFNNCFVFNQPLDQWNTSSLTTAINLFANCYLFNQPVAGFDVSGVTNMSSMFLRCYAFNQPIGNWDVGACTNFSGMFTLASSFDQDLSGWNTGSATTMNSMFHTASAFNHPVGDWDLSNVTNTMDMFRSAASFDQPLADWDLSQVTRAERMFNGASSFDQDISGWTWPANVYIRDFLNGVTLRPYHYDALLLAWDHYVPSNVALNSNSKCSNFPEVLAARSALQADLVSFSDAGITEDVSGQIAITAGGGTTFGDQFNVDRYGTRSSATALTPQGEEFPAGMSIPPIVQTIDPADLASPVGTFHGILGTHGGQPLSAQGFCYNTTGSPTTADDQALVDPTAPGPFSADVSDLTSATVYYVRAFATNPIGTTYGPEIQYTAP